MVRQRWSHRQAGASGCGDLVTVVNRSASVPDPSPPRAAGPPGRPRRDPGRERQAAHDPQVGRVRPRRPRCEGHPRDGLRLGPRRRRERPGGADEALDIQILQTASSLENLAVATYGAALELPFIRGQAVVKTFAQTTMKQHGEHANLRVSEL